MDITRFELKLHKLKRVVGELIMENRMIRQVIELVENEKKEESLTVTSRGYKILKKDAKMKTPRSSFYYKPVGNTISDTENYK